MIIKLQPRIEVILVSCNMLLSFLENGETIGNAYWEDENGDGFTTDIGYLFDGLNEIKKYCERKMQEGAE